MELRADTLVDPTFNPGTGANDLVESILVQPDQKILICGIFTEFNGVSRGYIARLNPDGSVDPTFNAAPSYWVRYMALQTDNKIVIGGFFTTVSGESRNRVARLNSDGSLDPTFNPGKGCEGKVVPVDDKDPFVFAILVQPDQKIVLAGNFATYNSQPASGIVRLNSDGSQDTSFHVGAGFDSWGRFLLPLPNNRILATGWMQHYDNQAFNRMVILNSDGSADPNFKPYFGDETAVYAAVLLLGGQMLVSGHSINGQQLFHEEMRRINPDGTVDTSYKGSTSDKTETIYLQPNGKAIVGGYFSVVDGQPRNGLARLNSDGTLDESFRADTDADSFVWTIRPQADGKIIVCGGFNAVDGIPRKHIARILTGSPASTGGDPGGGQISPPRISSPAWIHGQFSLSVPTVAGHQYILQSRPLGSNQWVGSPAVGGDGNTRVLTDQNATVGANKIYQVQVQ